MLPPCSKFAFWHNLWVMARRKTGLSPPVNYFTDRSKAVRLLWIFCFFCLAFVMPLCASVYMCLVVTCWERADLLALFCGILLWVGHFPIGILGQVWYLIESIPDLCILTYFKTTAIHTQNIFIPKTKRIQNTKVLDWTLHLHETLYNWPKSQILPHHQMQILVNFEIEGTFIWQSLPDIIKNNSA